MGQPGTTALADWQEFVAKGESLYRAGAYAEAGRAFDALPEAASTAQQATRLRLLGMCQLRLGDLVTALGMLRQAHALAPSDPFTALHYGFGLHAAGQVAAAAPLFAAAERSLSADPAPALNLAACLHALGDHAGAEAAARRARLRGPRLAQARYMLGLARLGAGKIGPAEAEFRIALRLDPGLAEAWVSMGAIAYQVNNVSAAKSLTRQALVCAPGHPAATANMATFLRLEGGEEEAEQLLGDALERDPASSALRLGLAVAHLTEGRAAPALALLEVEPPADLVSRRHWLVQKAMALIELGRLPEATAALDAVGDPGASLRPLVLWRRAMLARAAGEADEARRLVAEAEAGLTEAVLLEHRIVANYQLASHWTREAGIARGFEYYVRGHKLLARIQPYSRHDEQLFLDATEARFSRARLHDGPRADNRDPSPVFIVGMPRSGTTLTEQIIGAHAQAFAAGERTVLAGLFDRLAGAGAWTDAIGRVASLDTARLDQIATAYLDELHGLAPAADRIVDKMLANARFLGLVGLLLPGARIIHCVRDPRDIGLSIFTRRFSGYHPYAHDLADLGWAIGHHQRLMAHWQEALPNPILTLPMRDWIDDFDATLARVLRFIGLPHDPACLRFHEQQSVVRTSSRDQVREPINARGLDRWVPYAEQLAPMIAELRQAGLVQAGK